MYVQCVIFLFSWSMFMIFILAQFLALAILSFLANECIEMFRLDQEFSIATRIRDSGTDRMIALLDEIIELCHYFDAQPKMGVETNDWELVAATRSTNNGYRARQFSPVVNTSALNGFGDPFWPDYVDYVYMVEIREHMCVGVSWNTVITWQVSLFNGGQKKLHQFEHRRNWFAIGHFWQLDNHVICFQNADVILIIVENVVFIQDLQCGKSGKYELWQHGWQIRAVVSVSCLGRIRGSDGSFIGWRIRVLATRDRLIVTEQHNHVVRNLRACLVNMVFDVRETATMIHKEEIMFGWLDEDDGLLPDITLTPVRTKTGYGIQAIGQNEQDGPIMIFDESRKEYAYFATFNQFRNSDPALDRYLTNEPPITDKDKSHLPVVLSDNECIASSKDGTVYRRPFRLSSMKYTMAKAFFRSRPQLRYKMTADQFREATGLQGMNAPFYE